MKKVIFALFSVLGMTFIPANVNAMTTTGEGEDCVITIDSGESATINYDTNGCFVINNGNLTIANGANIRKMSQDKYSAVNNNGTLRITGGSIYAHYGYAVKSNAGSVTATGGTINSAIHESIWAGGGSVRIDGNPTLLSAGGRIKNIYAKNKLTLCNDKYTYNDSITADKDGCPSTAPAQAPAAETKPAAQTQSQPSTTNNKTQTVASSKQAETQATTETKEEEKEEIIASTSTPKNTEKTDNSFTPSENESLPSAGANENENNDSKIIAIVLASTAAVFGSALAGILISRIRR